MIKLLEHWIGHNDDHAESYRNWADKARAEGLGEAAGLLEEAAEATLAITETFRQAAQVIGRRQSG